MPSRADNSREHGSPTGARFSRASPGATSTLDPNDSRAATEPSSLTTQQPGRYARAREPGLTREWARTACGSASAPLGGRGGHTAPVVRRLRREDLGAAVRPMVRAFWDYPETLHLLPNERHRRHVLPRYLLSDARDALAFDTLFGAESSGARLVGAAAWIPPEAYPVSIGRQLRQLVDLAPSLPWGWRAVPEARRGQGANSARHRIHPPHYYLRAIGVDPATHSRGVGTSLMEPALYLADDRQVGCFLQTVTDANVAWYQRFGFRVVDRYRPTPQWPEVHAMWRDPAA
jgi:ribosomal protein S18 acetylase RimI-like enzyme